MTSRRDFLRSSAAFAAGSMFVPMLACGGSKKIIGLQLYTVRDKLKADQEGTLAKLAEIGYNSLEAAGYNMNDRTFYGMVPQAFADHVHKLGMPLHSSHTVFELDQAEVVCEDAAKAGCKYIIYPYLPDNLRPNLDGYKATAEKFNQMGAIAQKHGLQFGYHNHAFEFEEMEGQIPMDVLISQTDPDLVTFELDLYWTTRGGFDPVDYFKKFPGRFGLWHVKDMVTTDDQFFAPVGSGRIDFERIFAEKETAGMKYFFVEQDSFRDLDPFESVEISLNYLKQAKFV
ncbi:TIM barrel protein [uncultured Sunxiuqinia sp.]|uniref:TIM barrel protein n=1 Tax=uncultured Sunxiuqinia sp. TaxID=1573825 RepID=UPI002615BE07|nr:TIM barrel protein [uncultured Sunxiuqinia sp.]